MRLEHIAHPQFKALSAQMKRLVKLIAMMLIPILMSGCLLLNSVSRLPNGAYASEGSTVVLFGIAVEGKWTAPKLGFSLDEYDLAQQKITGNCWRFNRIQAIADPGTNGIQYFGFEVPAGHYVYSGFNGAPLATPWRRKVFVVPEGKFVYLGDFVYTKAKEIEIRQDMGSAQKQAKLLWPNLKKDLMLANSVDVLRPGGLFLCAP